MVFSKGLSTWYFASESVLIGLFLYLILQIDFILKVQDFEFYRSIAKLLRVVSGESNHTNLFG